MQLMTRRRFRHLPVVKNGRVLEYSRSGDLVKAVIQEQTEHIEQAGAVYRGVMSRSPR